MVLVDDIPFPSEITTTKPLALLGTGITDIVIHFLQIKYNAIGVYLDKDVVEHLGKWKGKNESELAEDEEFFEAVVSAPVEKVLRLVVIKEIKGSQYGVQVESAVRERLVASDKFEDEEDEALEKVAEFFQTKYFKTGSVVTYHFPANSNTVEISFATEGKDESKTTIENANVIEMIQKWYVGGATSISPTTVKSLAEKMAVVLSA